MKRLYLLAFILTLAGCGSVAGNAVTLTSPDGKSKLVDSSPLDSEWTLVTGKGCTIPTTQAQPTAPVVIVDGKVATPPASASSCDVQYAKSSGVGVTGFIGGLLSLGAGIRMLVSGF